jgi:hypothetical protein
MTVDTTSMRQLLETAPGEQVAMWKEDVTALLDVVDVGQNAAIALADLICLLPMAAAA